MYVFGTCTPRSGSQSLAGFLNHQIEINSRHESFALKWNKDKKSLDSLKSSLAKLKLNSEKNIYAEVNFSLIPYLEDLYKEFPDSKFIFLKEKETLLINLSKKIT